VPDYAFLASATNAGSLPAALANRLQPVNCLTKAAVAAAIVRQLGLTPLMRHHLLCGATGITAGGA